MYRDSFSETGWTRFVRMLSASFKVGRFFGVEVRLFYLALVITPLVLSRNVEGLPFGEGATYLALTTVAIFVVIWTHEMGHIVAGRRYGIRTPLITLSPLGGLAHMSEGAPSPDADIKISLAGPLTHLLWLVPIVPLWLLLDWGDLRPAGWASDPAVELVNTLLWINGFLMVFNLLPLFPMDGGRVLRAVLSKRMHPNRATLIACKVGTIGAIAFIAIGITLWILRDDLWGPILACIGISNLMACKQEKLATQHGQGPYMHGSNLEPWERDADAWKAGGEKQPSGEPGFFDKRKQARAAKREAEAAEQAASRDAEVDRILDRVNEVGLDGLSAKERKLLMQASKRRKDG